MYNGSRQIMPRVEEQYTDVLQNIEIAIYSVREENPDMRDYAVMRALESLIRRYRDLVRGYTPKPVALEEPEATIYLRVIAICEFRMGLQEFRGLTIPVDKALGPDVVLACLRRLLASVEFWNKKGGQRGYLEYIANFMLH
jgi:hypothetical protein